MHTQHTTFTHTETHVANYRHVPGIAKRAKKHCISAGGQRNQLGKKVGENKKQKMKRKYGQGEDNIFAAPPIATTADSSFSCARKQI